MFEGRQTRQLQAWQTEDSAHFLVQIRAIGEGRKLLPPQQLGDVGLRHLRGIGQLTLTQAQLLETLTNDEDEVHDLTKMDYTHLNV